MVVRPPSTTVEHRRFEAFPALLAPGDVLVVNETRVIRARLRGVRESGGATEVLLLRPADRPRFDAAARRWLALVRPARRVRVGAHIRFGDDAVGQVVAARAPGLRQIEQDIRSSIEALLERYGQLPLPPYVGPGDEVRAAGYQTVFARVPGSVAAPTASLHFTEGVLAALRARGIEIVPLVLEVGLATFRPIDSERIDDHRMHAESYDIPEATADTVNAALAGGRRIVVAGTTTLRALESAAAADGVVRAGPAETSLFITSGYRFRVAGALLTNFHLPASTLLVLVSSFAGYATTMAAYQAAIAERYRFYSFGDAMLIVKDDA